MPSCQVIIVGVLLSLLDSVQQFFLIVFVDELTGLLSLIGNQASIPPLLRQWPYFDALGFGWRDEPLSVGEEAQLSDFCVECWKDVWIYGNLHIYLPSTAFQKVIDPSAVPVMISARLADHVIALIFSFPTRVAFNLANFYLPGLSRSKTLIYPSSKLPVKR